MTKDKRKDPWPRLWFIVGIAFALLFTHRAWFLPEMDFLAYYNAGWRARTGAPLYVSEPTPFKYLPQISYLFIPFSFLPFSIAKLFFFFFNFAEAILVYFLIFQKAGHWITLASLLTFIPFHNYDFLNFQVNHILLLLLMLYLDFRSSHPRIAAIVMSVLMSFKVMPIFILAPLFFIKRFLEIRWIVISFFLLSLIPLCTFQEGAHVYLSWFKLMHDTTEFASPSPIPSIQGALRYWCSSLGSLEHLTFFSCIIACILLALCCLMAKKCVSIQEERRVLSATMIFSIIVSPLAWKHNYLLVLPAFVSLLQRSQWKASATTFFLMTLAPAFLSLFSSTWANRGYLILLGALVVFFSTLAKSSISDEPQKP